MKVINILLLVLIASSCMADAPVANVSLGAIKTENMSSTLTGYMYKTAPASSSSLVGWDTKYKYGILSANNTINYMYGSKTPFMSRNITLAPNKFSTIAFNSSDDGKKEKSDITIKSNLAFNNGGVNLLMVSPKDGDTTTNVNIKLAPVTFFSLNSAFVNTKGDTSTNVNVDLKPASFFTFNGTYKNVQDKETKNYLFTIAPSNKILIKQNVIDNDGKIDQKYYILFKPVNILSIESNISKNDAGEVYNYKIVTSPIRNLAISSLIKNTEDNSTYDANIQYTFSRVGLVTNVSNYGVNNYLIKLMPLNGIVLSAKFDETNVKEWQTYAFSYVTTPASLSLKLSGELINEEMQQTYKADMGLSYKF